MEGYRYTMDLQVIWRDLDSMGHVNNAVYATYFETGRLGYISSLVGGTEKLSGLILAEITITYKSPAFLLERLVMGVRVGEIRNSSFVVESRIEEKETGRLVATSRAILVHYDYGENKAKPVPPEWREAIGAVEGREV